MHRVNSGAAQRHALFSQRAQSNSSSPSPSPVPPASSARRVPASSSRQRTPSANDRRGTGSENPVSNRRRRREPEHTPRPSDKVRPRDDGRVKQSRSQYLADIATSFKGLLELTADVKQIPDIALQVLGAITGGLDRHSRDITLSNTIILNLYKKRTGGNGRVHALDAPHALDGPAARQDTPPSGQSPPTPQSDSLTTPPHAYAPPGTQDAPGHHIGTTQEAGGGEAGGDEAGGDGTQQDNGGAGRLQGLNKPVPGHRPVLAPRPSLDDQPSQSPRSTGPPNPTTPSGDRPVEDAKPPRKRRKKSDGASSADTAELLASQKPITARLEQGSHWLDYRQVADGMMEELLEADKDIPAADARQLLLILLVDVFGDMGQTQCKKFITTFAGGSRRSKQAGALYHGGGLEDRIRDLGQRQVAELVAGWRAAARGGLSRGCPAEVVALTQDRIRVVQTWDRLNDLDGDERQRLDEALAELGFGGGTPEPNSSGLTGFMQGALCLDKARQVSDRIYHWRAFTLLVDVFGQGVIPFLPRNLSNSCLALSSPEIGSKNDRLRAAAQALQKSYPPLQELCDAVEAKVLRPWAAGEAMEVEQHVVRRLRGKHPECGLLDILKPGAEADAMSDDDADTGIDVLGGTGSAGRAGRVWGTARIAPAAAGQPSPPTSG